MIDRRPGRYIIGLLLAVASVAASLWSEGILSSLLFLPVLLFFLGWPLVGLLERRRAVPSWYAPLLACAFGLGVTASIAAVELAVFGAVDSTVAAASGLAAVLNAAMLVISLRTAAPTERPAAKAPRDRKQFVAASCFIVLLVLVAYTVVQPFPSKPLTELYLLNEDGVASGMPYRVEVGDQLNLTVGLANHEGRPVEYHVQVWLARLGQSTVPNSTVNMYYLDTLSVRLDSVPMPLSGQWVPQHESDYNLTVPLDGTFRLWFFLFFDEVPAELSDLTPMVDYQSEHTLALIEKSWTRQILAVSIQLSASPTQGG